VRRANEAQTRDRGTNGPALTTPVDGLREGVLLEAGFAKVTPNEPKDISSWAYDYAADKVEIIDNRAKAVACYDPGYTLVEKLQPQAAGRRHDPGGFHAALLRCLFTAAAAVGAGFCRHPTLSAAQGRSFPAGGQ